MRAFCFSEFLKKEQKHQSQNFDAFLANYSAGFLGAKNKISAVQLRLRPLITNNALHTVI